MSRRKISYVETNEDRIKEINRCRQVIELVAPSGGCLTYLDFKVEIKDLLFKWTSFGRKESGYPAFRD